MSRTRLFAACVLACLTLTQSGWGQTEAPSAGITQDSARISVNFPGGTIGEYVKALRAAWPGANIVVSADATHQPVPEVVLRDVPLSVAISVLEVQRENDQQLEVVRVIPLGGSEADEATAFRVEFRQQQFRTPGEPRREASAWSVADLVAGGYTSDEVLAAIQVGQSLFEQAATIKYHEPTNLLVALGSKDQLGLIARTLDQLRAGRPGDARIVEAKNELLRQQRWLQQIVEQMEPVQTRIVEVRRQLEADDAQRRFSVQERGRLESELHALERQRDDLVTNRRHAEIAIQQAETKISHLRQSQ
jgi:type II secretory pathway component GspD/PulD (secretin)